MKAFSVFWKSSINASSHVGKAIVIAEENEVVILREKDVAEVTVNG